MTGRHCLGAMAILLTQWSYPLQKRLKSNGYLLKDILVSFYVAHDPSCPFTRLEIKPEDLFRSGLSVAKDKTRCVILFSFRFAILEGGLLCGSWGILWSPWNINVDSTLSLSQQRAHTSFLCQWCKLAMVQNIGSSLWCKTVSEGSDNSKNGDFLYLRLCNLLIPCQLEHIHHKIVGLKPISPTNHGRRHSVYHIYYYPLAEPESDI